MGFAHPLLLWLQQFCRQLRDCERGLLPNVKNKAGQ